MDISIGNQKLVSIQLSFWVICFSDSICHLSVPKAMAHTACVHAWKMCNKDRGCSDLYYQRLYICGNAGWKAHLPRFCCRFDLNLEVHNLDILWPGTAFTPPYQSIIDSGVDLRRTWGIQFDWTCTHRHRTGYYS